MCEVLALVSAPGRRVPGASSRRWGGERQGAKWVPPTPSPACASDNCRVCGKGGVPLRLLRPRTAGPPPAAERAAVVLLGWGGAVPASRSRSPLARPLPPALGKGGGARGEGSPLRPPDVPPALVGGSSPVGSVGASLPRVRWRVPKAAQRPSLLPPGRRGGEGRRGRRGRWLPPLPSAGGAAALPSRSLPGRGVAYPPPAGGGEEWRGVPTGWAGARLPG